MSISTGAERVLAAARDNGWIIVERDACATFTKPGGRRVYVEWSVRGAVTYGSTNAKRVLGSGKAEKVAAELAR